jgi:hypothetical protein
MFIAKFHKNLTFNSGVETEDAHKGHADGYFMIVHMCVYFMSIAKNALTL